MVDDLLSRIGGEIQERLQALQPAVQECERLRADLRALEGEMAVEEDDGAIAREQGSAPALRPEPVEPLGKAAEDPGDVEAEVEVRAAAIEVEPAAFEVETAAISQAVAAGMETSATSEAIATGAEPAEVAAIAPPSLPAPCQRPLLSPKVLRLMGSPRRSPLGVDNRCGASRTTR